jgi:ABC-type amino acid transport substrate-binding protein
VGNPRLSRDEVRRLSRRGFLATTAALLPGLAAAPARARALDDVVASGVLRVAVYEDFHPFSWVEDGAPRGIDVDIAGAMARHLKLTLQLLVRMSGENVDDDLRANVWRGPLTGGGVADVMLHVPLDRELGRRNELVMLANPYMRHRLAFAVDERTPDADLDWELFTRASVALEVDTVPDFYLLSAFGGAARANVRHFNRFADAADAFLAGETLGLAGSRAQVEGHLARRRPAGAVPGLRIVTPRLPGLFRSSWSVGTAVKTDGRDLSYALGDALTALRDSGALQAIHARHGVTFDDPRD